MKYSISGKAVRGLLACGLVFGSAFASGQAGMDMQMQGGKAPADARDPHEYSDGYSLSSAPDAMHNEHQLMMADEHNFSMLLLDRFEAVNGDENFQSWDGQFWYGTTFQRFVIKSEGDYAKGSFEETGTDFLYSRAVSTFWDVQAGLRQETSDGPDRSWLAVSVQGLAPYWFELDISAYLGTNGRTALSFEAEYELQLTQRLILQPRMELTLYGQDDKELGRGSGLSDISLGLRLRYEFSRQFAPYAGVEWTNKFGNTRDFSRTAGMDAEETRLIAGVRWWY